MRLFVIVIFPVAKISPPTPAPPVTISAQVAAEVAFVALETVTTPVDETVGGGGRRAGEDRVRTSPANWKLSLRWNKITKLTGRQTFAFCASPGRRV